MKQPVAWHRHNLINLCGSRDRAEIKAKRAQEEFIRLKDSCDILSQQIERAEREGKSHFDYEKYQPSKKRKS